MHKITKAFKIAQQLVNERLLTGAKVEYIKVADDKRAWLVDEETAILITQKYTHSLSERASEMYMIIGYNPISKGYRIYHNSGFSATKSKKFLGAVLSGHWEAKRCELIYSGKWSK